MSRFTLIISSKGEEPWSCLTPLHRDLCDYLGKHVDKNCCFELIYSRLLILLSNGLSRERHCEIFNELNKICSHVSMVSVLHEIPVFALYKASKLSKTYSFFYEEGVEREYLIGYFTLPSYTEDILGDIARRISVFHNVANLLLNTGSIPLRLDLNGVLAVLNRKSIQHLEYIKSQVVTGIASNLNAARAVEEAIRSINL